LRVATYLKISVAVALATIALKTGAWWVSDSVSLLSDALESLVNLAGAMFALAMVTIAARPPDEDHPYGHWPSSGRRCSACFSRSRSRRWGWASRCRWSVRR
jgi:divalent metal cation (Fe/Co/Zn/Cd) transporter